jgi:hypothetical protein
MIGRRQLLQTLGAAWFIEQALGDRGSITGSIVGADHRLGHMLRKPPMSADGPAERAEVVIVGSGVSGASAAWRLASLGIEVLMLELEPFAGGTSTWGEDGVVPHPWGAHYLPVPERQARSTQRLLEQTGVITGWDAAGRPQFFEERLCHAPDERIFHNGQWSSGLVPRAAMSAQERAEIDRLRELTQELSQAKGNDGRDAFAIPVEQSSRDPRFTELDGISMATWLDRHGFRSNFVRWFAQYATLDDFGGNLDQVSAWAGLHYFAARKLETEQTEGSRYLVWPEGNGWLVRQLLDRLAGERRHGALVTSLRPGAKSGVELHYFDSERGRMRRIEARAAVLATPAFIARRLLPEGNLLPRRVSSAWVVANLHVRRPADPNNVWDSVIYDSLGLGYVDAGHQRTAHGDRTVLTYFRAYGEADVSGVRAQLLRKSWRQLASEVLLDLSGAHPEIADQTDRIDVMVWGHAMPRPIVGFLGPRPFEVPVMLDRHIAWAHVDQTGFALFEEANLRGVRAAEQIAEALGRKVGRSWL